MSLSVGNGSSGSIGQRNGEECCCLSLTDQQKKVICTITGMLAALGFGAMVVLAVPSIGIVPWRVSLGGSLGLLVIVNGSIYFYPRSSHSAASAISAQGDVQQAGMVRPTLERYEQTRVAPPSGALARVAKVELQMIFSHFSLIELASMRLVSRCIYHITTQCVLDYIQQNKMLSASQLEMVSKFFYKPQLPLGELEHTRIMLERIPREICSKISYLHYNGPGKDLIACCHLPALRIIGLRMEDLPFCSSFDFSCFQEICQRRDIEIVLLDELISLENLEKVRKLVCPHSQEDDFSGIPVGCMKNVKQILIKYHIKHPNNWNRWTAEHTDLELEKLRTLKEETLKQITFLWFDLLTISPLALSGFFALLPNLRTVDLRSLTHDQAIIEILDHTKNLKKVYLNRFPGVVYDQVRRDLAIILNDLFLE